MLSHTELINPTDERVKKILQAGEAHFQRYGFRKSSIGDICKDAGLSKPTFYKYFDKKETLFFAVIIYLGRNFFTAYVERVKGLTKTSEKLAAYLETMEEYVRANPLFTEVFTHNPELRKSWSGNPLSTESYLYGVDFIEKIILEGIASGEFRVADPRRTAHVISLSTFLFSVFEPDMPGASSKSNASFLADLLLNGIVKRQGT